METNIILSVICVLSLFMEMCYFSQSCSLPKRRNIFYDVENKNLGITLLGSNFTTDSKAICASKCQSTYPSGCQSFIYDPVTKQCSPGGELDPSETKPKTGQFMYSNCDLSLGYSYSIIMQYGYCLYISPNLMDYVTAEYFCKNISGRLMIMNSTAKLQFFNNYTLAHNLTQIWIGLEDRTTEGTYIWSDQTQSNTSEILSLFLPGEPNDNKGNEDCCDVWRKSSLAFGLNDLPCNRSIPFCCEYVFKDLLYS